MAQARQAQTGDPAGFAQAWARAEHIGGWMTRAQAERLWRSARELRPGATIVEIGSHQGRSTVVLGAAARAAGARVVAIDPFVDGKLFGGSPTKNRFTANVAEAGLAGVVRLLEERSTRLRPNWDSPIDLLYIDGKHDYWTYTDDLRFSSHLVPGGHILVHDCFSSIGVTLGTVMGAFLGSRYTYLDRTGSLARLTPKRPSATERLRVLAQLPWFARNVLIKVLLRLRQRTLAGALGHDSPYDPY